MEPIRWALFLVLLITVNEARIIVSVLLIYKFISVKTDRNFLTDFFKKILVFPVFFKVRKSSQPFQSGEFKKPKSTQISNAGSVAQ